MDISTVASWIQIVIWSLAFVLWIGRLLRGEATLHPWLKKAFSSNGLIGTVVVLGLVMSGISLYVNHKPSSLVLNISAYDPPYPAPLRVVSGQTFEDQDIQLDGFIYENCTFKNVCFVYDGSAYGIHNSTIKGSWKVCVKENTLKNYLALLDATYAFAEHGKTTHKTVLKP
jgi:hypothetical protein